VLILDEPTNDLDTDMLAAMEDLLDSWPGTLLVVSHDRYLIERVTDQQYALLGGHLRHLPGGVEEYLKLQALGGRVGGGAAVSRPGFDTSPSATTQPAGLGGADRRDAEKELAAIDRRLVKLADAVRSSHAEFAAHDQSDYAGLGILQTKLSELESEAATLEERWLELSEKLERG
jgi:DNA repair exonuclease SbcCD ATPase subunit